MRLILTAILGVLAISVIVGCISPAADDDTYFNENGISFVVQDTEGNALDSVGIHFILDLGFGGSSNSRRENPGHFPEASAIELISFIATAEMDYISLDWATTSDTNHLGFEIERSVEGGEYTLISSYITYSYLVAYDSTTGRRDYNYLDYAITGGQEYSYLLVDIDSSGTRNSNGPVIVTAYPIAQLPTEFRLFQNSPNPFNPSTTIRFQLPVQEHVLLQVLNWWNGETVRTLVDITLAAGSHSVRWVGSDDLGYYVTNNIYVYRMIAGDFSDSLNMCLHMLDPDFIRSLNAIPLATTDNDGNALIDYSQIPLGQSVVHTDENGNDLGVISVANSINFVFLKEGYILFTHGFTIDTSTSVSRTITLEPI